MSSQTTAASSQYLSFILAGEEYALGILQVKEIIEYDTVTRVPGTPAWVRGVFNLRGSVVPVVDLAVKLGMAPSVLSRWSCIVVVEVTLGRERIVLGLLADAIGQVIELEPGAVMPPPSFGTPIHGDYLLGMGRLGTGRKFVLLLDIDHVLSSQEVLAASALKTPVAVTEPPAVAAGTGVVDSSSVPT
ncbi:Positive regulator of CheA protein activity [Archangium gephyra]|uniref:Positive regulator of CheA protein activity n=1 Tax=Archangium gephyra TaxID=48 RepID=A0AAC8TJ44_9BACT|nr:chemotaxis protein CheW [Archangium gephyra]AKJ08007.1 Positive regulator of CheA protein activity [Archangium gephyra]